MAPQPCDLEVLRRRSYGHGPDKAAQQRPGTHADGALQVAAQELRHAGTRGAALAAAGGRSRGRTHVLLAHVAPAARTGAENVSLRRSAKREGRRAARGGV